MQDSSASTSAGDSTTPGQGDAADSSLAVVPTPHPDSETTEPSTVLAEILPGIAVVFGDVPVGLDLVDFGLVPTNDRARISTALASAGVAATAGGSVGTAIASEAFSVAR